VTGKISKADIEDLDVVDRDELRSDGALLFKGGVSVVSTNSGTKQIVISGFELLVERDTPLEPGDKITLTGTSGGADGTYTINSVISANTLDVAEAIASSTGGTADFYYASGALSVGFDPSGLTQTSATTVQEAIVDLDGAISSGGLTETQHKTLRQLIHLAEEGGPFEGFASGAYQETLPSANPFPTSIIWWTSAAKTNKIVEETVTYNSNKTINTDQWKVYDATGTLLATVTDTVSYSGVFETSRTRTIT